jgi:hypothetical protein
MSKPLFKPLEIVKKAQPDGGELPQNSAEWPMRVRDEWLKAAPWAWDYPTEIELSEIGRPGSGLGFGHIVVTSKTALPPSKAMGQMGSDFGIRTAKVPIIIEDFKVYPLDMIKTEEGAILPLNEQRLGQALFRPTSYDIPGKSEASEVFGNPVYPPHREKGASFPMLASIAPTVHADQIEKMAGLLQKDAALRITALSHPETRSFFESVANIDPVRPLDKTAAVNELVTPDVVKITLLEGGTYLLKQASSRTYAHDGQITVGRDNIVRNFGEGIAKEADTKGIVIIMRKRLGEGEPGLMGDSSPLKEMESMGPCGVHGPGGPMMGWVLPRILRALTGDRMGSKLFTDGDHFGLQDSIGAEPADSKDVGPLRVGSTPSGMGVFCWDDEDGESTCTEPLQAKLTSSMNGRTSHTCETMDGHEIKVIPSPMAESVAPGDDGILIPKRARWVSIGDKMVKLPTLAEKQTEDAVKTAQHSCTITYQNGGFTFDGEPLRKIGSPKNLPPSDALFTCGLLGFSKESAERVLGRAMKNVSVKVAGIKTVVPLSEIAKMSKMASRARLSSSKGELALIDELSHIGLSLVKSAATLGELPRVEELGVVGLMKEAESLGDPQSVDALLSLGFLNIDNVSRFITYVPFFETVQKKLGILLLAARLGLSELPQDHISRCFFALEQVIAGLRRLSNRLAPTAVAS